MKIKDPFAAGIRLAARISGSLLVAFTLFFGIATFIDSLGRNNGNPLISLSPLIIIIFIFWGFALAGLVLALWKELLGGIISLACFVIMPVLNFFNADAPKSGGAIIIFLIFIVPSFLYIYYWWLVKNISPKSDNKEPKAY